ncbi:MAG TPA: hypothetical protein VFX22_08900 [Candidatus Kapabacteria bacterium]|nr:hypothetical protein [Candidatus Kapabacteria bacterium]
MKISMIDESQLSNTSRELKVMGCIITFYATMHMVFKIFAPMLYGSAASQSAIFRVEAIVLMPAGMIGIGLLALRANMSWSKLLLRSFAGSLIASIGVAALLPYF